MLIEFKNEIKKIQQQHLSNSVSITLDNHNTDVNSFHVDYSYFCTIHVAVEFLKCPQTSVSKLFLCTLSHSIDVVPDVYMYPYRNCVCTGQELNLS